ncbi:MAG: leucine-rich repeat domain-containing protein [Firmicutes bacterium]|nr:leucine-rich repeat domain-containing protein [Bacillota bacterium]
MNKKALYFVVLFVVMFSLAACVQGDELAKHKATAKAELENYAVAKGEDNYSVEKWAEVLGFVADGKAAIDAATDKPGVDSAVATAKGNVDGVLTTAQENAIALAEYKTGAKLELEAYAADRREYYTAENWAIVEGLVADGKTAIDTTVNVAGVDAAAATTKDAIKGVKKEIVEVNTEDMIDYSWFPRIPSSNNPGGVVTLKHPDENAVFECTVIKGAFGLPGNPTQYVQKVLVSPGNSFRWDSNGMPNGTVEPAFIDIILKIGDNIIGYTVFEILGSRPSFSGRLIRSVLFPQVGDEYQEVSEEYAKASIENVKTTHFIETDEAQYVLENTTVTLTRYTGTETTFAIPQMLMINGIDRKVTTIGYGAFYDCTALKSVIMTNNVTSIYNSAFLNCTALVSIVMSSGITDIGFRAFSGCVALKNITIPSGVVKIDQYAFSDCTALDSIMIPNSVTKIDYGAFAGWTNAQTIYVQARTSSPAGWGSYWDSGSNARVVWGIE